MARRLAFYLFAVAVTSVLAGIGEWMLGDLASLVTVCAAVVLLAVGLGLIIWAASRQPTAAVDGKNRNTSVVVVMVLVVSPLLFLASQWAVDFSLGWTDLVVHRSSYMHVIQSGGTGAQKPPANGSNDAGADSYDRSMWRTAGDGTRFAFDQGGSGRVVFPFPTRSRETRDGILYDPTGMEQQRLLVPLGDHISFVPDDSWTVLSCSPMVGRFYRCRFAPS